MLARILARQARRAKAALPPDLGPTVKGLREDFAQSLGITFEGDEGDEFFRSSLIQTVFYTMFAAWARGTDVEDLNIPVLGGLLHEIKHPQRLKALKLGPWLERAEATLARVERASFFRRLAPPRLDEPFDPAKQAANAILYFYEPFLESFDPDLRKELGVWYTPPEIVRYQVRRVDQLLRAELGCRDGLADPDVVVLDPACGTGAYLVEVLLCINERLQEQGAGADRGRRLVEALRKRVIGFEILTAPFVIAHLQLLLVLASLDVELKSGQRLAVYLTNALTGWESKGQLKLHFPDLEDEHEAARDVKRDARIIVVLGNPPYNRFAGAAIEEEASLVDHYKGITRNESGKQVGQSRLYTEWRIRKQLLDDLYIRFFRLAEKRIGEAAEHGVVSLISNSSYLTGRSHPLMRESLLHHFDAVWIDNLNGDKYRTGKVIPKGLPAEGTSDQSAFTMEHDPRGIQVGTCISTFVKRREKANKQGVATIQYRDFWGRAAAKRQALDQSLGMDSWKKAHGRAAAERPEGPRAYEAFTPIRENRWKLAPRADSAGYDAWPALDELFETNFMGVHTGKDRGVVASMRPVLVERIGQYLDPATHDAEVAAKCPALMEQANEFDDPSAFRQAMIGDAAAHEIESVVRPYLFRPLDSQFIWYETTRRKFGRGKEAWSGCLVQRYGQEFKTCVEFPNEFLITVPQPRRKSEAVPMFGDGLFDLHVHDRGAVALPVEVKAALGHEDLFSRHGEKSERHANIAPTVWQSLARAWALSGGLDSKIAKTMARRLLRTCLAICHAPTYQQDHAEGLAQDFAHVPIPAARPLFERIADVGDDVAVLLNPLTDVSDVVARLLGKDTKELAVPSTRGGGQIQIAEGHWTITVAYYGSSKGRWSFRLPAEREPSRTEWGNQTGDCWINDEVFFRNVPERIWRYELGGYPVLKKWLGYRDAKRTDGRELTPAEVQHFRSMVQRIAAILVLHPTLDELYAEAAANPLQLAE